MKNDTTVEEIWKIIEEFPNYSVSNMGRVRNNTTNKILCGLAIYSGRPYRTYAQSKGIGDNTSVTYMVELWGKDVFGRMIKRRFVIARLVLMLFVGPPPKNKPFALHKNDIKYDNRVENLYWGDANENRNDAIKNGKFYRHNIIATHTLTQEVRQFSGALEASLYVFGHTKNSSNIIECLKGKRKRAGSWTFRLAETERTIFDD